jgi:16S rRNA (uracil1498-N3)-methyltransferase
VDIGDRGPVATFAAPMVPRHGRLTLDDRAAHHAKVRRIGVGSVLRLTDGCGHIGLGVIAGITRSAIDIDVGDVEYHPPPSPLHLLVPIADRDRMLWLAEKCVELGITSWRAVAFHRSMSVTPRGEGPAFAEKVKLRMVAALQQCAGAWLPEVHPDTNLAGALAVTGGTRLLLDPEGARIGSTTLDWPVAALVGPEGGLESSEHAALIDAGWSPTRVEGNVLRFETAGIAAVSVIRSRGAI